MPTSDALKLQLVLPQYGLDPLLCGEPRSEALVSRSRWEVTAPHLEQAGPFILKTAVSR